MSKKYMYLFGAALLALSGVGASAQSAQAKGAHHYQRANATRFVNSRYFVNAPASVSSRANSISGTATRGIHVTLQNGRRTVASTYANRKTGRYTLRVPNRYRAGTNLKVVAQKGYQHPFRYVLVKTPANQKAAVRVNRKASRKVARKSRKSVRKPVKRAKVARKNSRKATKRTKRQIKKSVAKRNVKRTNRKARAKLTRKLVRKSVKRNAKRVTKRNVKKANKRIAKKVNRKANRKLAVRKAPKLAQTPTGTWTANQTKNYNQRVSFTQARGLNISKYTKRGRFVKKLVTNAPYRVDSIKPNFWKISYKLTNSRKTHVFYMHLLTRNNFEVTNKSGRKANLDFLRA